MHLRGVCPWLPLCSQHLNPWLLVLLVVLVLAPLLPLQLTCPTTSLTWLTRPCSGPLHVVRTQ